MGERKSVTVRLPIGDVRRWQLHVVDTLAADRAIDLSVERVDTPDATPAGLDLLFQFERIFVGRSNEMASDRVSGPDVVTVARSASGRSRLIVDLTAADARPLAGEQVLGFKCLGIDPLSGAVAALLDDTVPILTAELATSDRRRCVAAWAVAIEDRNNTLRGTSIVLGRLAHLVLLAVDGFVPASSADDIDLYRIEGSDSVASASPACGASARLLLRTLGHRIARRLDRLSRSRVDWRVITRMRTPGTPVHEPLTDLAKFSLLADDGQRFFADPFPVTVDGRAVLFVEEFPYATSRGIISVAEIGPLGDVGHPRPVLELDCHLSYPNVFSHKGKVWMIPETAGRGTIELWVADAFPDRWRLHQVLVTAVEAADATLAEINGVWWMFATTRVKWASSWDTLQIWTAPDLMGPWQPAGATPAVVDVGTARPAGRMFRLDDGWRRPVQDSTRRYGGGLSICKVAADDPHHYREIVETRFPVTAPLMGLHTWNQTPIAPGFFETFDIFADSARCGGALRLQ